VIKDCAMSGASLVALVCDSIEMTSVACMGAIDAQNWILFVKRLMPAMLRWKDRSLLADCLSDLLSDKEESWFGTYRRMLGAKRSREEVDDILRVFYHVDDRNGDRPLFYDDVRQCACLRVSLVDDEKDVATTSIEQGCAVA